MDEVEEPQTHPQISVVCTIYPPRTKLNMPCELVVEATLHHPRPVTVFTWPTILHPKLAQDRWNFECTDLETGRHTTWQTRKIKRAAYRCVKGSSDEKYFYTLEPGVSLRFSAPFHLNCSPLVEDLDLRTGHRHRLDVKEGEGIQYWKEGTRDEVLTSEGGKPASLGWACKPIVLDCTAAEFMLEDASEASESKSAATSGEKE